VTGLIKLPLECIALPRSTLRKQLLRPAGSHVAGGGWRHYAAERPKLDSDLALFLAVPAMRSPSTVPPNQSRDDRETLERFSFLIVIAQIGGTSRLFG
jgi:hypothetical protein